MSLKGGYKILDLSQNPSYDEIVKVLNTEKTILVSGLVVSGVKQKDCFASVEENEGVYTLKTADKIITIDEDNGVVVAPNGASLIDLTNKITFDTGVTNFGSELTYIKGVGIYLKLSFYTNYDYATSGGSSFAQMELGSDIISRIKFNVAGGQAYIKEMVINGTNQVPGASTTYTIIHKLISLNYGNTTKLYIKMEKTFEELSSGTNYYTALIFIPLTK